MDAAFFLLVGVVVLASVLSLALLLRLLYFALSFRDDRRTRLIYLTVLVAVFFVAAFGMAIVHLGNADSGMDLSWMRVRWVFLDYSFDFGVLAALLYVPLGIAFWSLYKDTDPLLVGMSNTLMAASLVVLLVHLSLVFADECFKSTGCILPYGIGYLLYAILLLDVICAFFFTVRYYLAELARPRPPA